MFWRIGLGGVGYEVTSSGFLPAAHHQRRSLEQKTNYDYWDPIQGFQLRQLGHFLPHVTQNKEDTKGEKEAVGDQKKALVQPHSEKDFQ